MYLKYTISLNQIILTNLFFIKKPEHGSDAGGKRAHMDNGSSKSLVMPKPVHSRTTIVIPHNGDSFHLVFVVYLEYLKRTAACFICFRGVSI